MRHFTLVLFSALAIALAGCSSDSESMTNSTGPTEPPAQVENQGAPPQRTQSGDKDNAAFDDMKPPGTEEETAPQ